MQAFYLKYRPQTLEDLIGQERIKNALLTAHSSGKLSHAYLFVGPRGTGKTSTARILAKMVNCGEKDAPCNKCSSCLSITNGSNLDLIEIDGASNRGIDDIRLLRENIKLVASGGKKKIYIIDEVHMLTTEAFNALLKTLEEPPEHALFILATTEVQKVPQTILSRVQRLDFKLASSEDLMKALQNIVKQEKLDIDSEALRILAKKASGSFRDAVKLLDQISSSGKKVTAKDVAEGLKTTKADDLLSLLEHLSGKKTKEAIIWINSEVESGIDIKDLTLTLMETMRYLMLIKNDLGEVLVKSEVDGEYYSSLEKLASKFSVLDLNEGLDAIQSSLEKLRFASIPSLPLELAVIEITQLSVLSSQLSEESRSVMGSSAEEAKTDELKTEKLDSENRQQKTDNKSDVEEKIIQIEDTNTPDMSILHEKWTFVLETIRPYNFSLEALLRSAKIVECFEGVVILEVPYSFHQRILETPKSKDLLESVLSEVLAKTVRVSTVLGIRPIRLEDIANVEIAADDEVIRAASEIFEGSLVE